MIHVGCANSNRELAISHFWTQAKGLMWVWFLCLTQNLEFYVKIIMKMARILGNGKSGNVISQTLWNVIEQLHNIPADWPSLVKVDLQDPLLDTCLKVIHWVVSLKQQWLQNQSHFSHLGTRSSYKLNHWWNQFNCASCRVLLIDRINSNCFTFIWNTSVKPTITNDWYYE